MLAWQFAKKTLKCCTAFNRRTVFYHLTKQHQLSCQQMTDGKGETWSPAGISVRRRPGLWWQTISRPRCSHRRVHNTFRRTPRKLPKWQCGAQRVTYVQGHYVKSTGNRSMTDFRSVQWKKTKEHVIRCLIAQLLLVFGKWGSLNLKTTSEISRNLRNSSFCGAHAQWKFVHKCHQTPKYRYRRKSGSLNPKAVSESELQRRTTGATWSGLNLQCVATLTFSRI